MGALRERQRLLRQRAEIARRLGALGDIWPDHRESKGILSPLPSLQSDAVSVHWHGGPSVLALLFAHPDSDSMRMIDNHGGYFDIRTGDTWDLFCPGYYRSTKGARFERGAGARPVGRSHLRGWYFSPADFNYLREEIEHRSERRWQYSGGTDLVLANGWLPEEGEPVVDWASTISGQVSDRAAGVQALTIAGVIERISRDLETAAEDPSYGVGEVTGGSPPASSHVGREFMINALAGIAAALGARALGA
jgi:hypothetical protein